MNRRGLGGLFCGIAAFLYVGKYISAAIYASNMTSWSSDMFRDMLAYIGSNIMYVAGIALIIGVTYIVIAEIKENKDNSSK